MGEVQRFWAGSLHSVEPDRLLYGIYVREQVVFASDYDVLKTQLTRIKDILARIDNCDAITIDRDFPQLKVDEAEAIWDDIHAVLLKE